MTMRGRRQWRGRDGVSAPPAGIPVIHTHASIYLSICLADDTEMAAAWRDGVRVPPSGISHTHMYLFVCLSIYLADDNEMAATRRDGVRAPPRRYPRHKHMYLSIYLSI